MYIISGKFKRHKLHTPKGDHIRPTQSKVRESLFNRIQNEIENALFLDLFAGSGIIGFEALSRGAKHTTFVEHHHLSVQAIKQNQSLLKVEEYTRLLNKEVFVAIRQLHHEGAQFDYIFADPPYSQGFGEKILKELDTLNLLKPQGVLWIEEDEGDPHIPLNTLYFSREKNMGRTFLREYITKM